jgi:hypothetical protein
MKYGSLSVVAVVLIVLAGAGWYFFKPDVAVAPAPAPGAGYTYVRASPDLVTIERPYPGATVGKEFLVTGRARGYWFFEASFPIEVIDTSGDVVAQVVAQAEGGWMTEDFVPFTATLKVPESYIGPATVVLHKDNPSGLPANDASVSFPITVKY